MNMALQQLQERFQPVIEEGLQDFIRSLNFHSTRELEEMLTYHMGWEAFEGQSPARGKRIRPLIVLLACGACETEPEKALPGAIAVELLHNFTLIHDDIEDNSPLRHGRPTLWAHWGVPQAINAGDALFNSAQLAILALHQNCGAEITLEASQQLNQACFHLIQGQYLDIAFETNPQVTPEIYFEMIEGKTAALLAFAAALGGLTAGSNQDIQQQLSAYGKSLGLAFQIHDDYLGIWGDPAQTGKSTVSDLMTHKKTLPALYGLTHCADFRKLWERSELSVNDVTEMTKLLAGCGAQTYTRQQAENWTRQAYQHLGDLFTPRNDYAEALFELTGLLLNRNI